MRETGKQRAQRIQLDYFRRTDGLRRIRSITIILATLAASAYGVFALTKGGSSQISTGIISKAHHRYEHDCAACHGTQWGQGISNDAWHPWPENRVSFVEKSCQACHPVADHFRSLLRNPELDRDCTICHHEHLGREYQPKQVADRTCTHCHADLQKAAIGGLSTARTRVVAFTKELHGDFSSLQHDTGRVLFDHAQHMRPGQVEPGQLGAFEFSMLDERWQSKYQQVEMMKGNPLVQLRCEDCHESYAAARFASESAHAREHAVGFQPVTFNAHCSACHALNFEGRGRQQLPLPHAAPWTEVDTLLQAKVSRTSVDKVLPDSEASAQELQKAKDLVRQRCLKCHTEADIVDPARQNAEHQPFIPRHWLKHGFFNHAAHVRIDCQYCHPGTAAEESPISDAPQQSAHPPTDQQTVMIRGIESCTGCHRSSQDPVSASQRVSSPDQQKADTASTDDLALEKFLGTQPRSAAADCQSCHRYHWSPSEAAPGGTVP